MRLILLIVLILILFGGGGYTWRAGYAPAGYGLGGIALLILVLALVGVF